MMTFPAPFLVLSDLADPTLPDGARLVVSLDTRRVICRCIDEVCASTVCCALNDLFATRPAVVALLEGKVT